MEVMNKFKSMFGFNEEEDFEDDDYYDEEEDQSYESVTKSAPQQQQQQQQQQFMPATNNSKVVSIHSAADAKVVITRPTKYDESVDICTALRNRNIVIINTSALETKVARRLLDFVSGAAYALDGNLDDIENRVYIVSPSNVHVSNELKSELSSKGIFNWK
ncbi:MAG: cell division protein SepF [Sarcina sp.]